MKRLVYLFLYLYVLLGLKLYFRRIVVKGRKNIPRKGAVMFLANHQNALLDALLIATTNGRLTHYLARADLFKNSVLRALLNFIHMQPVYRMRDGRASLPNNAATFRYCRKVFDKGECLVLFPEGNHDLRRRLRTLSKGFTRIIDHALSENAGLDLKIVPVGLNYTDHKNVQGSVSVIYGEAIDLRSFLASKRSIDLKAEVSTRLKKLITHIEDLDRYDSLIHCLESKGVDYLTPVESNKLVAECSDKNHAPGSGTRSKPWLWKVVPFASNLIPSLFWLALKGKIKDPVFISTLRFAGVISLFPLYFILQGGLLWYISPPLSLVVSATALFSVPICGRLLLKG